MPFKSKSKHAAYMREWRIRKRQKAQEQRVNPPVVQRSSVSQQRPNGQQSVKSGYPAKLAESRPGNVFDTIGALMQGREIVANGSANRVTSAPAFMHPKVRSIHEVPERAWQELYAAGGSRQGNAINFPAGFDGAGWKRRWMR